MLLLLGKGFKNVEVAKILGIHRNTVSNIKKRYVEEDVIMHYMINHVQVNQKKYGIEEETSNSSFGLH